MSTSEGRSARGHRKSGSPVIAATPLVYRSLGRDRRFVWTLAVIALIGGTLDSVGLYLIARLATSLTAGSDEVEISVRPFHHTTLTVTQALLVSAGLIMIVTLLGVRAALVIREAQRKGIDQHSPAFDLRIPQFLVVVPEPPFRGLPEHLVADFTPRYERLMLQLTVMLINVAGLIMAISLAVLSAPTASLYFIAGLGLVAVAFRPAHPADASPVAGSTWNAIARCRGPRRGRLYGPRDRRVPRRSSRRERTG